MKSSWNNRQGNRDRKQVALLVTEDGNCHLFKGDSIPGVCHSTETGFDKNGKWSSTDFEVVHRDTTVFVSWMQSWDTGVFWPQVSWEDGFVWLAEQAPNLSRDGFDALIRKYFAGAAEKWDERRAAELEFATPREQTKVAETAEIVAKIKERKQASDAFAEQKAQQLREVLARKQALSGTFERTEQVRNEAEDAAAFAQKLVEECEAKLAEQHRFGSGAFDCLIVKK